MMKVSPQTDVNCLNRCVSNVGSSIVSRKHQSYIVKYSGGSRFSRGGAPIPKLGLFCKCFAENCMKMKEFGPKGGGRVPGPPPLDPPMK